MSFNRLKKTRLLESFVVNNTLPLNYNDFNNTFNRSSLNHAHPSVYLNEIKNAYVSPYGVVFNGLTTIKSSIAKMHQSKNFNLTFHKKILFNRVKYVDEECLLFHHVNFKNYYHWFLENITRLIIVKDLIKDYKILLPPVLKKFHYESLNMLGVDMENMIRIRDHELLKCKKLIFPGFTAQGFGRHNPFVVKQMADFFITFKANSGKYTNPNIYLSRKNCDHRKCVNEIELKNLLLSKYGFVEYVPDELPMNEQMELFYNAKNIIGVHASSFVNMLYMKNGGIVIDLIEENHNDLCYFNISQILGIGYVYMKCKGMKVTKNHRNDDIQVDINVLDAILEKLLK